MDSPVPVDAGQFTKTMSNYRFPIRYLYFLMSCMTRYVGSLTLCSIRPNIWLSSACGRICFSWHNCFSSCLDDVRVGFADDAAQKYDLSRISELNSLRISESNF